ncbi:hypothetical protein GGF46_004195 [Coemansia sp. RSA 552]|nr:hypothetical protein GGF46_004195 [Coemansia sp. RSA 552]
MPELPDVERARKLLHARCVGRKIVGVDAADDSIVFVGKTRAEVARHLQGHSVTGTGRRGKQFWLLLTGGSALLLHFGMTGEVHIRGEPTAHYRKIETAAGDQWPPRFTKLELEFDGGSKVAYTDPRRLGRIRIHTGDIADVR